jgi:outer membrane protein assembly factor BamE (lipoprotein component of BamABCDE complex)
MRQIEQTMSITNARPLALCLAAIFFLVGCDRNPLSGSRLTAANYDQVRVGMNKAQVERILGPPTSVETKDMLIFKKTTYRYEDGKKFAIITFKNDEVDSKDCNLGQAP